MRKIPEPVAKMLCDPVTTFDAHCHVFNRQSIPSGYMGVRLPMTKRFLSVLEGATRFLGRVTHKDGLTYTSYFLDFCGKPVQEIVAQLYNYYYKQGSKTIFCPLTMDMDPSIKGRASQPYETQVANLHYHARVDLPNEAMLPFMHVNPDNPACEVMFHQWVMSDKLWGVKIYPSLGCLPSHPRLMRVFAECEKNNIPVTAHCSAATVHTTKKHFRNIQYIDMNGQLVSVDKWFWTKDDYSWFNNPKHWEPVLRAYPKLRLNLAHFGGFEQVESYLDGVDNTWTARILDLMARYPNVYSDTSFTLFSRKALTFFKQVMSNNGVAADRLMYGSDYYMVVMEGHFRTIKSTFESEMGREAMHKIAQVNPRKFLF